MRLSCCLCILVALALLPGVLPRGTLESAAYPPEEKPGERNLAIVVNLNNPVENLSTPELRRIFLGERGHWPNPYGRRITLVMLEPGWPERDAASIRIWPVAALTQENS